MQSADRSAVQRYLLAAAIAAAAIVLHWMVYYLIAARLPYLFFLPALTLTAVLVGRGPAFVVAGVGVINAVMMLRLSDNPAVPAVPHGVSLMIFAITGFVLAAVCPRWRLTSLRAAEVERHLRMMQENTEVGFFEIDFVRRRVVVSDAVWTLTGHRPAVLDRDGHVPLDEWNALLKAVGVSEENELLRRKAKTNRYDHEHRITMPNGKARWLFSKVAIERNAEGRAERLYCASVDITERKHTELLLEETRGELWRQLADFRRLHELSNEILELPDLNAQLAAILRTLTEFHRVDKGLLWLADSAGKGLMLCASVGFSERAQSEASFVPFGQGACGVAGSERQRVIIADVYADPRFAPYRFVAAREGFRSVHSMPLISLSGELLGVMSVHAKEPLKPDERELGLADICAQKAAILIESARARDLAEQSERRFRVVVDSSALAFCLLAPAPDRFGRITDFTWQYLNSTAVALFGYEGRDVIGHPISDALDAGWDVVAMLANCGAAVEEGISKEFELRARTSEKDGSGDGARWFRCMVSPLPEGAAVWLRDVTLEKTQERALREADRRKDEFLAMLAHELRNPLAPIRQAARIVREDRAGREDRLKAGAIMERQVRHMSLLLDDLMDVGRITSGKLVLKKAVALLESVVESAEEMVRPMIEAKHQHFALDLPAHSLSFEADALRVSQILFNLLANASKYTPEGGHISLSVEPVAEGMRFIVRDDGIGIDKEALQLAFQMFYQVSHQPGMGGGLGIGLALARGLVELHGGHIEAESEGHGKGSCFTVFLPCTPVEGEARPAHPAAAEEAKAIAGPAKRPRRVLVADDNEDAADTLATLLRLAGNEVSVAYDGAEALAAFERFHPEIALLDVGMPKMSGFEVARRVRNSHNGDAHAKLVAITGWGQAGDRAAALEAGFDMHMTKPVDPQRVIELVN